MARKQWKVAEERLAKTFGSTRRPLSGGNDKRGRDDSLHPRLFLENKYSKCLPIRRLWEETRDKAKEEAKGRTPVVGLQEKGKPGILLVINSQDLEKVLREWARANGQEIVPQSKLPGRNQQRSNQPASVLDDSLQQLVGAELNKLLKKLGASTVSPKTIGPITVTSPRKRPPTPRKH